MRVIVRQLKILYSTIQHLCSVHALRCLEAHHSVRRLVTGRRMDRRNWSNKRQHYDCVSAAKKTWNFREYYSMLFFLISRWGCPSMDLSRFCKYLSVTPYVVESFVSSTVYKNKHCENTMTSLYWNAISPSFREWHLCSVVYNYLWRDRRGKNASTLHRYEPITTFTFSFPWYFDLWRQNRMNLNMYKTVQILVPV